MKIDIETLRETKGIGSKTLERIIKQHELDNNIKSFKSEYIPSNKYKIDKDINLWQGDCLELMSHIPDKSIDMILCDLPYGTTACSWDEVIPFEPLWSHYKRIIKDNGVIVLFGSEPFSTKLRRRDSMNTIKEPVRHSDRLNNKAYQLFQEKEVLIGKLHSLFGVIQNPDFITKEDCQIFVSDLESDRQYFEDVCQDILDLATKLSDRNTKINNW